MEREFDEAGALQVVIPSVLETPSLLVGERSSLADGKDRKDQRD